MTESGVIGELLVPAHKPPWDDDAGHQVVTRKRSKHYYSCRDCNVELPKHSRLASNHFSVRFDDDKVDGHVQVLIGPRDVSDRCSEALAGYDGFVVVAHVRRGEWHTCPCGSGKLCENIYFASEWGEVIIAPREDWHA